MSAVPTCVRPSSLGQLVAWNWGGLGHLGHCGFELLEIPAAGAALQFGEVLDRTDKFFQFAQRELIHRLVVAGGHARQLPVNPVWHLQFNGSHLISPISFSFTASDRMD